MFRVVVLVCIALFTYACNQANPPTSNHKPPSDKLSLNFRCNPITIDPRKNSDPISCALISMLYEGLTHLEADGSISLGLAKSIEISDNDTKYTFHLKKAYWSNGDPITSHDVISSWKKILQPDFPSINAYFLYPIKNAKSAKLGLASLNDVEIEIEDDFTFTVFLEHSTPHFLKMLAFVTYFPVWAHMDEHPSIPPPSSGPFLLKEWKQDSYILLEKNPYFWDSEKVKLSQIFISIIPDENTAFKLHQLNEIDLIGGFIAPIPYDEIGHQDPSSQQLNADIAGTTLCFFNTHSHPFNNLNIRKAFAYAIDKHSITTYITQNKEMPAKNLVPPLLKNGQVYDLTPEGSKELAKHHFELGLKELNITRSEFPKLIFSYYSGELEKKIALTLQEQWSQTLQVQVSLECLDIKIFLDKLYRKNYQFGLMSILAQYFDQMNFLERFLSTTEPKNFSGWSHPKYVKMIEHSFDALSAEERFIYLEKAEALLMNELPVYPLYHNKISFSSNPRLHGVSVSPAGILDFRYAYLE